MDRSTTHPKRLRIALVGTRGVPARYGGFETCAEEIGKRLVARGHRVVVYCRGGDAAETARTEFEGMELVHLPALKRRALETLSHTGLSAAHLFGHRVDAAIVFNAANSPWLPVLRMADIPVATHVDGLEWKRAKWGRLGKRYYRMAETLAVRWSDMLIADAAGIQDYYRTEFGVETRYLAYGAPIIHPAADRLAELDLEAGRYHLAVARFEPENHIHLIVQGYVQSEAKYPLVVVGSAPYADAYTRYVHSLGDDRVRFVGGVWDQELLDQLYGNASVCWHGHSVGGTNPSLLRAMGAGAAINAFDVNFNREVLGEAGEYFADPYCIPAMVDAAEGAGTDTRRRGELARELARKYDWDTVADGYEQLCGDLAALKASLAGKYGRRSGAYPLEPARALTWLQR